ncbi:MAG: InlB B-repeat-containing protein [Clostridia bacterium]|nr:InlB B-repeat-containing protein [Clostridia bacterium]
MKKYGHIISKLRKKQGLTQEQLGKKLNVSYQAISKWENNLSEPDLETLEKLTEVFGISMSEFFDMAKNPENIDKNTTNKEENNIKESKNFIKTKPWYLVAGLGVLIVILSLCAFLIPVNYSSSKIYEMVDPSVFCITAEGPSTKQAGSGFFINDTGLAVTNYHVIQNCTSGKVQLNNGKTYDIKSIVGCDENKDIAIIQIDIKKSKGVKLGNSNKIEVGDIVYAIGYPESFQLGSVDSTFTQGIISKTSYSYDGNTYIQTTVDMTRGNSGGVLVNQQGQVIGITTLMITNGLVDYMNMAIPINKIKDIKQNINLSLGEYTNNHLSVFIMNGNSTLLEKREIYKGNTIGDSYYKNGYIFKGWYEDPAFTQEYYSNNPINENIHIYVDLQPIKYTIKYLSDNTTIGEMNNQEFTFDQGATLAKCRFKKEGYMFSHWLCDGKSYNDEAYVINLTNENQKELNFEVIWAPLKYKITFDNNGGSGVVNAQYLSYNEEGVLNKNTLTKKGYSFGGWLYNGQSYNDQQSVLNLTTTEKEIVLKAIWNPITYFITYNLDNGINSSENPEEYIIEDNKIILKNASKLGYTFKGWYINEDKSGNALTEINPEICENINLYASYSVIYYDINYIIPQGATMSLYQNQSSYTIEKGVYFGDITPKLTAYTFNGWFDNENFEGDRIYSISSGQTGEKNIYAKMIPIEYTIEFRVKGGTLVESNPTSYNIETETFYFNNPTKAGCDFIGWYDGYGDRITRIQKGTYGNLSFHARYEILQDNNGNVLITTPEALLEFAEQKYMTKNAILQNDLDMSGYFINKPIGLDNHITGYSFSGSFDGQNYVIYNLTGSRLFGRVDGATIRNVHLKSAKISCGAYETGAFVGISYGAEILNCSIQGEFSVIASSHMIHSIGGFIGDNNGTITNCFSDLNMTITISYKEADIDAGLFVGFNSGNISNCYSTGNLSLTHDGETMGQVFLGGFAGSTGRSVGSEGTIDCCYTDGDIYVTTFKYVKDLRIGGFSGFVARTISNCYASGNIYIEYFSGVEVIQTIVGGFAATVDVSYSSLEERIVNCMRYSGQVLDSTYANTEYAENLEMLNIWTNISSVWDSDIWEICADKNPTLKQ